MLGHLTPGAKGHFIHNTSHFGQNELATDEAGEAGKSSFDRLLTTVPKLKLAGSAPNGPFIHQISFE